MEYYKPHNNDNLNSLSATKYKYTSSFINNRAIHNDIVYIENNEVVGIKERNQSKIVGVLCLNKNTKFGTNAKGNPYYLFKPLNPKYPNFYVASKSKNKRKIYVVIQFLRWEVDNKNPIGMLIEEIGEIDIINNEYKALLYQHNLFYSKFKVPKFKLQNDMKKENELQQMHPNYYVFSIDPEGCKDIDDAFHYIETETEYQIGVHITDIYEYFNENYINRINQSSSVYMPTDIRHLLPEIYSEDICSLLKERIRKTVMVLFKYTKDYKYISTEISKEIVKIRKNYNYDQVDKLLSYDEETTLHKFFNTSMKISNKINDSHSLVEYFMIEANKAVAEKLYNYDKTNTILRIQNGTNIDYKVCNSINPNNKFDDFLKMRAMECAKYYIDNNENSVNIEHTALGIKYYTHFTSPIRRLADIYTHLQINKYLNNEKLYNILEENTNLLDNMNRFQRKTRKLRNDIKKINIIYDLEDNYETTANIIDYNERYILIYIPLFDITHKIYNYSTRIDEIVNIDYNDEYIYIKYDDIDLKYYKYDEIYIRMNSIIQEDSMQRKLNIKIL